MESLIIVFVAYFLLRAVSAAFSQRRQQRRQQNVEEQRRRREAWMAQQRQNGRDLREHPWQERPAAAGTESGHDLQPPLQAGRARVATAAGTESGHDQRPPQAGRARVATAAGTESGHDQRPPQAGQEAAKAGQSVSKSGGFFPEATASELAAERSHAADMFAKGLSRREWINGIIVGEILAPPLAKRGRRYRC